MSSYRYRSRSGNGALIAFVLIMIVALVVIIYEANARSAFTDRCKDNGGHVSKHHGYKDTTYYCLTSDGRIIDVR